MSGMNFKQMKRIAEDRGFRIRKAGYGYEVYEIGNVEETIYCDNLLEVWHIIN